MRRRGASLDALDLGGARLAGGHGVGDWFAFLSRRWRSVPKSGVWCAKCLVAETCDDAIFQHVLSYL